jgi:hypothetical protein
MQASKQKKEWQDASKYSLLKQVIPAKKINSNKLDLLKISIQKCQLM